MSSITYNLFRRRDLNGFCCAIPEDRAVPGFVKSTGWIFSGKLDGRRNLSAFDEAAARASVRYNGFYVFEDYSRSAQGSDGVA